MILLLKLPLYADIRKADFMIDRYLIKNLFGINGLNIAWYGVIIGFGVLLGVLIACREAKRQK